MLDGYSSGFSGVLGHEFVGRVEAVNNQVDLKNQNVNPQNVTLGARVVGMCVSGCHIKVTQSVGK